MPAVLIYNDIFNILINQKQLLLHVYLKTNDLDTRSFIFLLSHPYTLYCKRRNFRGEKYSCFLQVESIHEINSMAPVGTPTLYTKINSRKN